MFSSLWGRIGSWRVAQRIFLFVRYNDLRDPATESCLQLRYTGVILFPLFLFSKYMYVAGFNCANCCTVSPQTDKMSAEPLQNFSNSTHFFSGVRQPHIFSRGIVLTVWARRHLHAYGYMATWVIYGMNIHQYSLIVELIINAVVECAYWNPPLHTKKTL